MAGFAAFQLFGQNITDLVELGGFAALTGNDQRRTCLIDQDRVDLVDNTIMKRSLYKLFFINNHVITKIIKAKLIIGDISNVTIIGGTALLRLHVI